MPRYNGTKHVLVLYLNIVDALTDAAAEMHMRAYVRIVSRRRIHGQAKNGPSFGQRIQRIVDGGSRNRWMDGLNACVDFVSSRMGSVLFEELKDGQPLNGWRESKGSQLLRSF